MEVNGESVESNQVSRCEDYLPLWKLQTLPWFRQGTVGKVSEDLSGLSHLGQASGCTPEDGE